MVPVSACPVPGAVLASGPAGLLLPAEVVAVVEVELEAGEGPVPAAVVAVVAAAVSISAAVSDTAVAADPVTSEWAVLYLPRSVQPYDPFQSSCRSVAFVGVGISAPFGDYDCNQMPADGHNHLASVASVAQSQGALHQMVEEYQDRTVYCMQMAPNHLSVMEEDAAAWAHGKCMLYNPVRVA